MSSVSPAEAVLQKRPRLHLMLVDKLGILRITWHSENHQVLRVEGKWMLWTAAELWHWEAGLEFVAVGSVYIQQVLSAVLELEFWDTAWALRAGIAGAPPYLAVFILFESESKFGPHTVIGDSSLQSFLTERFCFLTEHLCEVMGICSEPSPQFLGCHLTLSDALFFCPFYVGRNKQKL